MVHLPRVTEKCCTGSWNTQAQFIWRHSYAQETMKTHMHPILLQTFARLVHTFLTSEFPIFPNLKTINVPRPRYCSRLMENANSAGMIWKAVTCPMEQMPLIWTCFASTLGFNQFCSLLSLSTVWHTLFVPNSPPPDYLLTVIMKFPNFPRPGR